MDINKIMASLEAKHPGESEYLQAVKEVLHSIEDIYNQHPEFEKASLIERLVEPDRIFTFKVPWVDDNGKVQVNLGYRVQFNNAIGPYKGVVELHAVTQVHLYFTFIVYPRHLECKDAVWFNQSLNQRSSFKLWMLVVDIFNGMQYFLYSLQVFRFTRMLSFERSHNLINIHNKSI